jgi:hypothetical protein
MFVEAQRTVLDRCGKVLRARLKAKQKLASLFSNSVPQGRLNLAQDASPGLD